MAVSFHSIIQSCMSPALVGIWLSMNMVYEWNRSIFSTMVSGLNRMVNILQMTSSNLFIFWTIVVVWFKVHWSLFVRLWLIICHHWYRNGKKPLSKPILSHFCLLYTRPQWVNTFCPEDCCPNGINVSSYGLSVFRCCSISNQCTIIISYNQNSAYIMKLSV